MNKLELKIKEIINEKTAEFMQELDDEINFFLETNTELLVDACKDIDKDYIYDYILSLFQDEDYVMEEGYSGYLECVVLDELYPETYDCDEYI